MTTSAGTLLDQLRATLAEKEREVQELREAIAALSGPKVQQALAFVNAVVVSEPGSSRKEFEDLGITAATKKYLRSVSEPQSTREIADALLAGGLQTKSQNFIATVYSTLANGKMFYRTSDGRWELHEEPVTASAATQRGERSRR